MSPAHWLQNSKLLTRRNGPYLRGRPDGRIGRTPPLPAEPWILPIFFTNFFTLVCLSILPRRRAGAWMPPPAIALLAPNDPATRTTRASAAVFNMGISSSSHAFRIHVVSRLHLPRPHSLRAAGARRSARKISRSLEHRMGEHSSAASVIEIRKGDGRFAKEAAVVDH